MNKVLTLMLALAMISMTTRAAMKKDSAKPKTEQVKKKKKDKTAKEFSNKKLYTFASKRGIMVMNAKGTGLTTLRLRPDAPEKDRSFAFLFVNGKHYLYSPTAKKFLSADGSFVDHIGSAFTFDKSQADGKFKYMLSTTNKEGQSLYVNTNDSNKIVINSHQTADDGNRWQITPAGKFNPKDAMSMAQKPAPKYSLYRKGLFNVLKEENDWFFEIPDSLIGRDFLNTTRYTSTPSGCGLFGGEMISQQTVYFQKGVDNQLLLRVRLFVNVSDSTQSINKAIIVSNENPIIASFKIESHNDKLYKIKVTSFLTEDNPNTALPRSVKSRFQLTNMFRELSYVEDIKSFPLNTEVRMVKTYNSSGRLASARSTDRVTFGIKTAITTDSNVSRQSALSVAGAWSHVRRMSRRCVVANW